MQYYPEPKDVAVPFNTPEWPSKSLLKIIEKDGLIVPILVYVAFPSNKAPQFIAADQYHGERVRACVELGFETLLVETEWTDEDL